MSDTVVYPRILWRVDLSCLMFDTRIYCQSVHILKSHWKLLLKVDAGWEEYKIYIIPENPEVYLNMRFFVQCGIRDMYGTCRYESSQTTSTENLSVSCIWGASTRLLLEEHLIQNNLLWVVCIIEPQSSWEDCQILSNSITNASYRTSIQCTDSLTSDFKHLHEHALHHDVILECENKTIKAHRSILSCRSSVFEGMFRSDTKEALEGKVVIHDTPFHVLEKIIRYIYTTEIKLENVDLACEIYVEADKYLIQSLKKRCSTFFKAHLCASCTTSDLSGRVSDACKILCLADECMDVSLQSWIKDFLAASDLLITPEWNNFAENNLQVAIEVYFRLLKKIKPDESNLF